MTTEAISKRKKSEKEIPDVLTQLKEGLKDAKEGRVHRVR